MVKDTTTYILTHFSDDDDDIDLLKKVSLVISIFSAMLLK